MIVIETITESQYEKMDEWRSKWMDIGLSCEPLDFAGAKKYSIMAYKYAGLDKPGKFVVFDSPVSAAVGIAMMKSWASVGASVWESVRASVGASVGEMIYGSHDAGWMSHYSYFRDVLGLREQTDKLTGLLGMATVCGWWSPYRNLCAFQQRHCELNRDEFGRIHNENGAAVLYRDGWGVYAWHGVRVPEWVIRQHELITVDKIRDEDNAEIRRAMISIYGMARYIKDSGAQETHRDEFGVLYSVPSRDGEIFRIVRVVNHTPEPDKTFKEYFLNVNRELRPMRKTTKNGRLEYEYGDPQELTARNAVASTFGMRGEEYRPVLQS